MRVLAQTLSDDLLERSTPYPSLELCCLLKRAQPRRHKAALTLIIMSVKSEKFFNFLITQTEGATLRRKLLTEYLGRRMTEALTQM